MAPGIHEFWDFVQETTVKTKEDFLNQNRTKRLLPKQFEPIFFGEISEAQSLHNKSPVLEQALNQQAMANQHTTSISLEKESLVSASSAKLDIFPQGFTLGWRESLWDRYAFWVDEQPPSWCS